MKVNEKQFEQQTGYNLSEFYSTNFQKLAYLLMKYVKDEPTAKNLANDAFIRALDQLDKFDKTKSDFVTWLFTVGKNLALAHLKKRNKHSIISLDKDHDGYTISDLIAADEDSKRDSIIMEKYNYVKTMINTLPEKYKSLIVLRELENLTYQEIEDYTGLKEGTIKSRIRKGRHILQKICRKTIDEIDNGVTV